ncbi:uncharacterized protein HaLaN_10898 [Haematococcus lacustris]|uniref:AMP-binding domain-containing protein n=1 Tax=Haematococcus lacustris TaxID=44745 RepID=A0A699Z7F5_HAELA|nr:uncharacterized protein HaLaN_10898 [Haematococcus lacustris]
MFMVVEEFMLHVGGSIGYFQGDIRKIMADIDALKPTLFAGVPRVFERIYSGVQDQLKKGGAVKNMVKAQFQGYYKNAELTQEAVDADGFFHTGDIGELEPSGALKIIDRKKNLFKLSHGEYIAVERIENVYKNCPLVEMLWVYGNSFESCLVAVVVPKEDALRKLAADKGVEGADAMPLKELCRKDAMVAAVLGELKAEGKSAKLKGFEEIKAVLLETVPFSPENDLMTPSFKLKRAPLLKHYQPAIKAMYDKR